MVLIINNYIAINIYRYYFFFLKVLYFKKYPTKVFYLKSYKWKNNIITDNSKLTHFCGVNIPFFFFKKVFLFFSNFIKNIFKVGYNVLFVDINYNYNYIPVSNKILFSRSLKDLYRYVKMFNVSVILLLDVGKKKFVLTKLSKLNIIRISASNEIDKSNLDLNLGCSNSPYINYIVYTFVVDSYLKNKI